MDPKAVDRVLLIMVCLMIVITVPVILMLAALDMGIK